MICDDCEQDKPDVMKRSDVPAVNGHVNPKLCTACCSKLPGREWMKESAS